MYNRLYDWLGQLESTYYVNVLKTQEQDIKCCCRTVLGSSDEKGYS